MTLLGPFDPHPVRVSNPEGAAPFLLVSDHAGRRRPRACGDLGVAHRDWDRHIAYDIGIKGLGALLARTLDACLVEQRYSRLVIDCNRPPGHESSIPRTSEHTPIPANHDLTGTARREREEDILHPYQRAIAACIARRQAASRRTILIALHSFTPTYDGIARRWDAAILHENTDPAVNDRFAPRVLHALRREPGLVVGDNEPYRLTPASDYTVPLHAWSAGLDHVELEIRQDLIGDETGQAEWAARMARLLRTAAEQEGEGT
jgi:predicted N-formylglutamate amidohydrolase